MSDSTDAHNQSQGTVGTVAAITPIPIAEGHALSTVTARFVCESVTRYDSGESVKFTAIWSGHREDNNYSEATPSGSLELYISNKNVHGFFVPQQVYNLLITRQKTGE
jgi:hypothetical protein